MEPEDTVKKRSSQVHDILSLPSQSGNKGHRNLYSRKVHVSCFVAFSSYSTFSSLASIFCPGARAQAGIRTGPRQRVVTLRTTQFWRWGQVPLKVPFQVPLRSLGAVSDFSLPAEGQQSQPSSQSAAVWEKSPGFHSRFLSSGLQFMLSLVFLRDAGGINRNKTLLRHTSNCRQDRRDRIKRWHHTLPPCDSDSRGCCKGPFPRARPNRRVLAPGLDPGHQSNDSCRRDHPQISDAAAMRAAAMRQSNHRLLAT
jgi:hypothetical protein